MPLPGAQMHVAEPTGLLLEAGHAVQLDDWIRLKVLAAHAGRRTSHFSTGCVVADENTATRTLGIF